MTNLTTPTPRLIAFIRRHWSRIRITVHTVLWLFTFGLANYSLSIITPDDIFVRSWLTPGISLLTLTFFYVSGYIIFPRYLYVFRPVKLLISLALLFLLVHVCTYALLYYLHTYNPVTNNFINRYWFLFEAGGLFGCFTSVRIAIQDVILTSNVSFIYLVPKVAKDLVVISRALQLEGDKFQLEGDKLRLERDNLNLELSFLKAQINPHFLLNTLNSVYARIFEADQQAANLILHLSELMRYNLYETDQPRIGLDKELAYVQNYLDLERNRLSGQDMLIDYEQSGEPANYQIAPLLLIAFVENAFKHGVKGAVQPAYVQVRAEVDTAGKFVFIVENSLPERKQAPITAGTLSGGVGLPNVRRRLEALYAGQYSLNANTDQHTYMITLAVQLEQSSRTLPTAELA